MKARRCILTVMLALLPWYAPALRAQDGAVSGTVRDAATGAPLASVNVTLERAGAVVAGTATDEAGRYRLGGVPAGVYALLARHVGYRRAQVEVALGAQPIVLDLQMAPEVVKMQEVEVSASLAQERADAGVSLTRIRPEQVRQLAGGAEDVLRALQALPGVLSAGDFASQLVVRGGTPDQNLILLDDIEVFSPYQLSGLGSLLNPATIGQVDLYAGAFPARYGDRLSSVLAVQTRDGAPERTLAGRIGVNLLSLNLLLEGRTGFWQGSWLVSGRRTYFDSFANTFARRVGVFNEVAFPDFADGQVRLALRPARGHTLRLTALHSRDALDFVAQQDQVGRQEGAAETLLDGETTSRNTALGLSWSYAPNADVEVRLLANAYRTGGGSDLVGGLQPRDGAVGGLDGVGGDPPPVFGGVADTARFAYRQAHRLEKATLGGRILWRAGRHSVEAGGSVDWLRNTLDLDLGLNAFGAVVFDAFQVANPLLSALADSIDVAKTYRRFQVYVMDQVELFGGSVFLQPGLRYDYFGLPGRGYLSPRLNLSLALAAATTVRLAGGRYVQSPGFEKLLDPDNVFNLARFAGLDSLRAEEAWHLAAGVSRRLDQQWHVRLEVYWKQFEGLIEQASRPVTRPVAEYLPVGTEPGQGGRLDPAAYFVRQQEVFALTTEPVNGGGGEAYGVEALLERRRAVPADAWSGWLSYAYARADRRQTVAGQQVRFPFDYDRRHTLNLVLNRRLGRYFDLGLTWRYGSGFPYTPALGLEPLAAVVTDPASGQTRGVVLTDPATGRARLVPRYGDAANVNAARLPAYHRLDARLTFAYAWPALALEVYLDLINLYNRRNTMSYQHVVEVVEPPPGLPLSLRPPPRPVLFEEPVYMFPFIPSFGLNLSFR